MFGIPGLENPQVEPLFHGLLQRMQAIGAALSQLQSTANSCGAGAAGVAGQGQTVGGTWQGRATKCFC